MDRAEATDRLASFDGYVDPIARIGLGLVILLAGLHKLVDPGAWAVYVEPIAFVLPMTTEEFMLLNGVLEPPFALAVLLDRYTVPAAAFIALSLSATVLYLTAVAALTGDFVTAIVRDVGLTALAVGVTVRAAARESENPGRR